MDQYWIPAFRAKALTDPSAPLFLSRVEILDSRVLPAVYAVPVTADGVVADRDFDGVFETLNTAQAQVAAQLNSNPAIGDQRAVFEFTLPQFPAGEVIVSVALRLNLTAISIPASLNYMELNLFGSAGNGQVGINDVDVAFLLRDRFIVTSTYQLNSTGNDNRYDVALSPGYFASNLGPNRQVAISLQMFTFGAELEAVSRESTLTPADRHFTADDLHPKLIVTTAPPGSTPLLTVDASPSSISEDAGPNAGTVTVNRPNGNTTDPLVVILSSTDPSEATVPNAVTIPANSTSVQVNVTAVDDDLLDGPQTVQFVASANQGLNGFGPPVVDPLFGGESGIQVLGYGGVGRPGVPRVAVQADGKIVTLLPGEAVGENLRVLDWELTRVNPDGSYDTEFGNQGVVIGTLPDPYFVAPTGLMVQDDGKILIFGTYRILSPLVSYGLFESWWYFVRYNPDGSLDSTFGTNGVVIDREGPPLNTFNAMTCNLVPLSDGRFLALGTLDNDPNHANDLAVVRYLANGTRDITFGNGGVALWHDPTMNSPGPVDMAVQSDGKIVVVDAVDGVNDAIDQTLAIRFTEDGFLDSTFGAGGIVTLSGQLPGGTPASAIGTSVVIQPDGKIVLAANSTPDRNKRGHLNVFRMTSTGQMDPTFGQNGIVVINTPQRVDPGIFLPDPPYRVTLQNDGRILVSGGIHEPLTNISRPVLVRLLSNGTPDESFAPNGLYIPMGYFGQGGTDIGFGIADLAWQSNGQLIGLAASAHSAFLLRYGSGGLESTALSNAVTVTDHESLSVTYSRPSISEAAGPSAALGVVVRSNTDVSLPLVVNISTSDPTEAVSSSTQVTIPAGSFSTTFDIQAVDDALFDGNQTVTFTATAVGYVSGVAPLIVTDNEVSGTIKPGDILVTRPAAAPNTYEIAEFTPAGALVLTIPVPWGTAGTRPASEVLRDLIQDQSTRIYLYNGTNTPFLTSYNQSTVTFGHQNFSGWSSGTSSGSGGIATFHQFVFVSDNNTASGVPAGIVRFDRRDNTVARFSNGTDYQDLTIGLNGLLYALKQNQHIDVYDPVTMTLLSSVTLPAGDYRGLAVRADGLILAAGADGFLYLFDSNGTQLNAVNSGAASLTDIDIEPGGRVIAGSLAGEVVVTNADLAAPTKFTASTTEAFVAFAIDANFPVPTIHTSPGPFVFPENDPPASFDPGLLVTDDGDNLVGATVTFTSGYLQGFDRVDFVNQNGIQGTFDSQSGTLTLTGVSSVANYQAALRSVAYHTTSDTPALTRTITVTVSDGVNSAAANRVIQVSPQNDPPGIFPNQFFFVPENSPNTTAVGTVQAFDDDSPVLSGFAIVSGNGTGIFAINPATGQITVADGTQLDYETRKLYTLGVTVSDGSLTSPVQTVTIFVTDENDNPPVIRPQQVFSVQENSAQFTVFGTVSAFDVDTVGFLQDFTIVGGNASGAFGILPDSGELFVMDGSQLDYEGQKVYTLSIQVSDGVNLSAIETITINLLDSNDETPVVLPATFTVPENSVHNTPVGIVTATDADVVGTLQDFALVSGNPAGAFQIDTVTGLITVNNSVPLNFEATPVFNLGVTVSDGLHTSAVRTIVVQLINVNEAPSLSPQTFSIPELSAGGTVLGTIQATDPDAGQSVTYAITSGNAATALTIHPQTGVLSVQLTAVLDFEKTPVYTFTVTATDNGTPTQLTSAVMTVNLTNVNDAPLIQSGQSFTIAENSANGVNVGTVAAQDADVGQSLAYSITAGNSAGAFTINPGTGVISVADGSKLDFETTPIFTLTVKVTDNGVPALSASAAVQVQVTNVNEPPVVTPATFTVTENSPKPTVVGTVTATDPDAGQQKLFSIIGGNVDSAFSIHLSLGTITVNNPAALDFEATPTFSLLVRVQDNGSPSQFSTATITVNLLDAADPPIVNNQSFSVSEAATSGTAVGTIVASDPDQQAVLVYEIVDGDPTGVFGLNSATGLLRVLNPAGLDFETQNAFTLQVQVTKPGNPPLAATATVTVLVTDANDAPSLGNMTFDLPENSAGNTVVGTLTAIDPDLGQTLTYTITGGNPNDVFQINPSNGVIRVSSGAVLDFETTPDYVLSVMVSDSGSPQLSQTAQVTIHLIDVNESPMLNDRSVTIPENTSVGTVLATLLAANPELGQQLSYAITGGNANNSFTIDPATGQLSVASSGILNFEVVTEIVLTVQVTDDGQPALSDSATFTIHITDLNEAPHLVPASFTLEENSPVGTVVGTIPAVDEDAGQHVLYAVTASELDGLFAINSEGLVTIAQPGLLDFETHPVIHFNITASDDANPSASETKQYTLTLTNVDEPPEIVLAPGVRILSAPLKKQAVDSQAFIRDVDTPVVNVANSTVHVNVTENRAKSDKARLLKSKRGELVFKGKNIFYQGTLIGERIYGKKGGVPLTIHFNGAATQTAVEGVLQKISFRMKGIGGTRMLEFSLTGLDNGQSSHTKKAVQRG